MLQMACEGGNGYWQLRQIILSIPEASLGQVEELILKVEPNTNLQNRAVSRDSTTL